jgi:hypothetical protein
MEFCSVRSPTPFGGPGGGTVQGERWRSAMVTVTLREMA